MARKTIDAPVRFPKGGLNVVSSHVDQPEGTSADMMNVVPFDIIDGRIRGGMRRGLAKYCSTVITADTRIQDMNALTIVTNAAPSTTGDLNRRLLKRVAVVGGVVKMFDETTVTSATTAGSRSLDADVPFMFSAELFGKVYFVDGISYKVWDAATNATTDLTPTAGSLPGTDGTKVPRLITNWRSRLVVADLASDPHNWFMSALGDPLDWDYSPEVQVETQASTGSVGVVGKGKDTITCLIPFADDTLIIGCDHSIWQMSGDPQLSGRTDMVTDKIGIAYGNPWCKDQYGNIYFFSNDCAVYKMNAGDGSILSLTDSTIAPLLEDVNLNNTLVRMAWDVAADGFHLFFVPIAR